MDWTKVRGFATDAGSRTYHTAILARSLEVPAVVGLHDASRWCSRGSSSSSTATRNELILDPDDETLARVERTGGHASAARAVARRGAARSGARRPTACTIRLEANIEFPDDLAAARYAGAEGIGLYRSEFLLTGGGRTPSEDAQYEIYRGMLEGMAPGAGHDSHVRRRRGSARDHATRQRLGRLDRGRSAAAVRACAVCG